MHFAQRIALPPALLSLALLLALIASPPPVAAAAAEPVEKPFLHPLFTDNMVLQRDRRAPIWGWTKPGSTVTVTVAGKTTRAAADASGKWTARVGPLAAGGPLTVTIRGAQEVTLANVLVGDVWICSGQSNMEMGIGGVNDAANEIARANDPQIRLYTVPKRIAATPQELCAGQWQACTPATVEAGGWGGFSAVGYFFGRHLREQVRVPIGLIHTSWGGTVAEAWTSAEALSRMDDFRPAVEQLAQVTAEGGKQRATLEQLTAEWYRKNDPGSARTPGWMSPELPTDYWKTMDLPQNWEQAGLPDFDGVVWFRRDFELPDGWAGKNAVLHLGPIDDRDTTWVNGTRVGGMEDWIASRDYKLPAGVLKQGRNTIAVRVLDTGGGGGFHGKREQMALELAGAADVKPLSLAGAWRYRDSIPLGKATPVPQSLENNPNVVTVLYNGMIAPLVPFAIKGAIWYQGESNAGRARQYQTLLPTMIRDWRARFGVGDFPFFIVQLANFMAAKPEPGESAWAELREAQLLTSEGLRNTGLAVAIDIGDAADIHPKNKQDVGRRLGLAAQGIAYGQKLDYAGPRYRSMQRDGHRIRLKFDRVGGGLVAKGGGRLQGFAIAGADGRFVWGDAAIEGDTVVVSSQQVAQPTAVRYGWADNPDCNLYDQAGLPASPFRTDRPGK